MIDLFTVTKVKNCTSCKHNLKSILQSIDDRFCDLRSSVPAGETVCFPVDIFTDDTRQDWIDCDPDNADMVIKHLEDHINIKINEISIVYNIKVIRKILNLDSGFDPDFDSCLSCLFPVTFNNSDSQGDNFNIIISPGGGLY